jgi:hypothetical protein
VLGRAQAHSGAPASGPARPRGAGTRSLKTSAALCSAPGGPRIAVDAGPDGAARGRRGGREVAGAGVRSTHSATVPSRSTSSGSPSGGCSWAAAGGRRARGRALGGPSRRRVSRGAGARRSPPAAGRGQRAERVRTVVLAQPAGIGGAWGTQLAHVAGAAVGEEDLVGLAAQQPARAQLAGDIGLGCDDRAGGHLRDRLRARRQAGVGVADAPDCSTTFCARCPGSSS